jgi:hypothetical protein
MKKILLALVATLSVQVSNAYLTINETAEILPDNFYKIGIAPQLIISDGGGFNVGVFADMHLFDDVDGRITFGSGKTDFWTQASMKWVPFPDVDRQPAMGLRGGLGYARDEDLNFVNFQITPLISKKADTRYGNMIPYVGLPVTYISTKDTSFTATQFTLGAEWFPTSDRHIGAELNLNLNKSFSSVSVYFSFPFEGSTGYIKH